MNRSVVVAGSLAALLLVPATSAVAQRAVAVSGHVTSRGRPLAGAHVRVDELRIDRRTDASGRYSFLIPSAAVRGQQVRVIATMSDRRLRYIPRSATIDLTGAPVTLDFDLAVAEEGQPVPVIAAPSQPSRPTEQRVAVERGGAIVDSGQMERAGPVDLPGVLVGRFAGLNVAPAAAAGGSFQMTVRGPRSILQPSQPLVVVDGLPMSNTVFTSAAQRFGFGGFDHGSPLSDLDVGEIASVRLLNAADGAAAFGARGANGVVLVTTRSAADGPHFGISASQQATTESYVRVPAVQRVYGQGLDGLFEFFDGRGGGINDAVAQNWGPRLDGRPLLQSSYAEAGRPDVRYWTAHPSDLGAYLTGGSTSNTTVSVQGRTDLASIRVAGVNRNTIGITPDHHLVRRGVTAQATLQPSSRLHVTLGGRVIQTRTQDAPGTGLSEGNAAFQLLGIGRQVDLDSLERYRRDADGQQISWNYDGHDNPFFLIREGDEHSRRNHATGSGSATYAMKPWLSVTARGGVEDITDDRGFTIPGGWMGGFPFFAGRGNFAAGGWQNDRISVRHTDAGLHLDGRRTLASGATWTLSGGADLSGTREGVRSAGIDSIANVPAAGAPESARLAAPVEWNERSGTNAVFGETGIAFTNGSAVRATLRNAWISMVPGQRAGVLLPSVRGSFDAVKLVPALASGGALDRALVHAGWWRAAPDVSPFALRTIYAGRTPTGAVAPLGAAGLALSTDLSPEITNGVEVGADLAFTRHGLGLGVNVYREQTTDVILPLIGPTDAIVAANAGTITNQGVEATLAAQFGDGNAGLGWSIRGNAARNSNRVDRLSTQAPAIALAPDFLGVSVQAREGQPLGVLMGSRYLRSSNGELLLRNGLPVADSLAGPQQLGVAQPTWILGLESTLRYRWVSVSAVADAHLGGQIFSATNLMGSYAGALASTALRPDSGLLISGIDAATGGANTQHVSTQDYFHALAAIQEPWVYSATYLKLRSLRVSVELPTTFASLPFQSLRLGLVGRNLFLWTKAPNIDPEVVSSPYQPPALEMGQLAASRSIGVQFTIVP